ncbi:MAG: DUF2306 domain-containing protein [Saprospiraceae bacterium]|nr:DUF2306 domain-containing protein [Saprospiraceae bacterium]
MKKTVWILFAVLSVAIGFYPMMYLLSGEPVGVLSGEHGNLLNFPFWKLGFYCHITFGGIALLSGWSQFNRSWRNKWPRLHRQLGLIYVISAWLSGLAGFGIGFYAMGGTISQTGFVLLGMFWLLSTTIAYLKIRQKQIDDHEKWMIFSYAACFAAVTLRLWLPILIWMFDGNFLPAYRVVAWLCWVPNLLFAAWWNSRKPSPVIG